MDMFGSRKVLAALLIAVSACAPRAISRGGERLVIARGDVETRSTLNVPPGHMPPVGQCRLWFPGRPPGKQPRAGSCAGIQRTAPAGSWILYRPSSDKKVVHTRVIDPERAGVVIAVRVYDLNRGTLIKSEKPR